MTISTKMLTDNLWQVTIENKTYKIHAMTSLVAAQKAQEIHEMKKDKSHDDDEDDDDKKEKSSKDDDDSDDDEDDDDEDDDDEDGDKKKKKKDKDDDDVDEEVSESDDEEEDDPSILGLIRENILETAEKEGIEISEEDLLELINETFGAYTRRVKQTRPISARSKMVKAHKRADSYKDAKKKDVNKEKPWDDDDFNVKREETDIQELSPETLGSYVKKSKNDASVAVLSATMTGGDERKHYSKIYRKRSKGIDKAADKLVDKVRKEETGIEQSVRMIAKIQDIRELSPETLGRYKKKATKDYEKSYDDSIATQDKDASEKSFTKGAKREINVRVAQKKIHKKDLRNKIEKLSKEETGEERKFVFNDKYVSLK